MSVVYSLRMETGVFLVTALKWMIGTDRERKRQKETERD
jgi:hypothetical protein